MQYIAIIFAAAAALALGFIIFIDVSYSVRAWRGISATATVIRALDTVRSSRYGTRAKRRYQAYEIELSLLESGIMTAYYRPGLGSGDAFLVRCFYGRNHELQVADKRILDRTKELLIGGGSGVLLGMFLLFLKYKGLI